ncbi:MAG: hypothetical protein JNJ93_11210 [Acinetobacter sp.]|nr:hypothetical protein [Acinetobacter sp.]
MDMEWIKRQRDELDRLLNPKKEYLSSLIKFDGFTSLSNRQVGAAIACADLTNLGRARDDKNELLQKIRELEAENKELRHKLVLKTLGVK